VIKLRNIGSEAHQRHTVLIDGQEAVLTLRFLPFVQEWFFDVELADKKVTGISLSLNTLHIQSANFPFDFIVVDTSTTGLDPYKVDDFSSGRCELYMLDRSDMIEFRGQDVPL